MGAVAPRTRLAGRYVIEDLVATGGMASVWTARDEVLARTVAVKVLRDDLADRPDLRERFRREAVSAARLTHPSIISIFDTGVDDDVVFIVMEHFPGRTLAEILAERGPLDPPQAIALVIPVLEALAHAHAAGVVHRDVKPDNILVGPGNRVKVADFGIARAALGEDLTTTGKILGTVRYLSPEQVRGDDADERSDVYSVGVVLYELVTGHPPFRAEGDLATAMMRLSSDPLPPRSVVPGLPRAVESAILRAMALRPEDRFPSAEAMRAALERWAGGAEPPPPTGQPGEPVSTGELEPASTFRSWMLIPLLLVAVAALAVGAGLALGRLELGGPLGIRGAEPGEARGTEPVKIADGRDFDPLGDGSENPEEVPLAIDGRRGTAWFTDHYNSAAFGGLKPGLGLFLDLRGSPEVTRVVVTSPLSGWRFQLIPGADPNQDARPLAAEDGSTRFTVPSSGRLEIELRPATIPGLMIWVTELTVDPQDGRFAAAVDDVTLSGPSG